MHAWGANQRTSCYANINFNISMSLNFQFNRYDGVYGLRMYIPMIYTYIAIIWLDRAIA